VRVADILLRNLPDRWLETLKERAARSHRSVQQELHAILAEAVGGDIDPLELADTFRRKLEGRRWTETAVADIREDRQR